VVSLFIYISSLYRLALFSIFRTHGTPYVRSRHSMLLR